MRLDSFKPGLVYEEQEGDFPPTGWLVLELHESDSQRWVSVTELELFGPNAGRVATVTIPDQLAKRYTLLAEAE